ncbi:MAG TPA: P-II family nitrogen regulator [Desulfosalsimonadaceae bacterium]|nr:P-II family nitrogen regulator [Desulfosalsimonadaceae bacterium]
MSNSPEEKMQLVVIVVKDHHQVEDILTGFLELGLRGATVVDVRGMGQIISSEIPIFTGFKSLFPGWGADTYMIMSVVDSESREKAFHLAREVCDNFESPGSGIMFTLPVFHVEGLAEEIR